METIEFSYEDTEIEFKGMDDAQDIFYKYYYEKETGRRLKAIKLLEDCDFSSLNKNYIHYLIKIEHTIEIHNLALDSVIDQLIE